MLQPHVPFQVPALPIHAGLPTAPATAGKTGLDFRNSHENIIYRGESSRERGENNTSQGSSLSSRLFSLR